MVTIVKLNAADLALRYIVGSLMIGAVLLDPIAPHWMAIVATYPIFTAILRKDPFYQLLANVASGVEMRTPPMRSRPAF